MYNIIVLKRKELKTMEYKRNSLFQTTTAHICYCLHIIADDNDYASQSLKDWCKAKEQALMKRERWNGTIYSLKEFSKDLTELNAKNKIEEDKTYINFLIQATLDAYYDFYPEEERYWKE